MFDAIEKFYERTSVKVLGYTVAIHFEEVILILAGCFIGGIIVGAVFTAFIMHIRHVDKPKEGESINITRVDVNGKSWYKVKVGHFFETFRQMFLVVFSPPFTKGRFTGPDKRRTRIFIVGVVLTMIIVIIFAILAVSSNFTPDEAETMVMLHA